MNSSTKSKILIGIIVSLIIYSIFSSVIALDYYEEYNRVQSELADLAVSITETEKDLETAEDKVMNLNNEITKIRTEPIYSYISYSIPFGHNSFRSWMPSSAISKTSKQGQYVAMSTPDNNGLLKINDCYCVALGTYYGELGDIFRVTTSTGNTFRVIKIDVKSDNHTDTLHQYTTFNSCMMEFVVNKGTLNPNIKVKGFVNTDIISGDIVKIEKEILK